MFDSFQLKIRRRETPFYAFLYRTAKGIRCFRIPAVKVIYVPIAVIRGFLMELTSNLLRIFYYEPLFRVRCAKVGKRLMLVGGLPLVQGQLKIYIGDDCEVYGKTTLASTRVYDEPKLIIGNKNHIGYQVAISVGQRVEIGNHVLVASGCFIADNDGHPFDYLKRRGEPVSKEQIQPVKIEDDCWIGSDSMILKGVTIGQGSIVGTNSVVTRSVPPFCIAAGMPAKVLKELPIPEDLPHLIERREREMGRLPEKT